MHGLYLLWWEQENTSPLRRWRCSLLRATWRSWRWRPRPAGSQISSAIERASSQDLPFRSSACFCVGWARVCPVCSPRACWWRSGDALRSGADQALLYRTCLALDRETGFQRIQGQTYAWHAVALLVQYSRAVSSSNAGVLPQDGSSKRFCAPSAWASRGRWSSRRVRATRDRSPSPRRRTTATPGQHGTRGSSASRSWR